MADDLGRDADFMDGVWHQQDTTPSDIAAALQELLKQRHDEDEAVAPARVLNLVVIVDRALPPVAPDPVCRRARSHHHRRDRHDAH